MALFQANRTETSEMPLISGFYHLSLFVPFPLHFEIGSIFGLIPYFSTLNV